MRAEIPSIIGNSILFSDLTGALSAILNYRFDRAAREIGLTAKIAFFVFGLSDDESIDALTCSPQMQSDARAE